MAKMPKISIIMGYYNRIEQLTITLDSIQKSSEVKNIEVIIIDDASSDNHIIPKELIDKYTFHIKVWKIPIHLKKWRNPVIPYNLGFEMAKGEWIIIQNPEVCHVGDICHYVTTQTKPDNYYAFSVFSLLNNDINQIVKKYNSMEDSYSNIVSKLGSEIKTSSGWYCHKDYRPKALHFCTAIHRSKLDLVGGFYPRMKDGVDYDDDEFLLRVSRVCNVFHVWDVESKCFGIHLWHPKFAYQGDQNIIQQYRNNNIAIYQQSVNNPLFIQAIRSRFLPPVDELIHISNSSFHSN